MDSILAYERRRHRERQVNKLQHLTLKTANKIENKRETTNLPELLNVVDHN